MIALLVVVLITLVLAVTGIRILNEAIEISKWLGEPLNFFNVWGSVFCFTLAVFFGFIAISMWSML